MTFDVACEDYLMKLYREENFPVTIIRPSHTYDERSVPLGVHGDKANSVVFDCSKLKSLVPDFVATNRADQGIRETIEYVLAHPECQVEDPNFDKWCDEIIERMK